MASFHIPRSNSHFTWNRDLAPAVTVDPGATVSLEVANASGGQFGADASVDDVARLDFSRVNPVTGPVFVRGAEPGDSLVVDILSIDLDTWGWTANIPGFGLLADAFQTPHLRISKVSAHTADLMPGLRIPVVPFIGTIGVAMPSSGDHPIVPPSPQGGNMDIRHITPGARLHLPIAVHGALLSLGDTHAAQGDGEVCGTAIETSSVVTVRVHLEKGGARPYPMVETHPRSARQGRAIATTGIAPDLFEAARAATRGMIEEIVRRTGVTALDAYLVASVAGDLKISEVVDAPNWVVSMHLEKDILNG
ncbi:MAG: acetamidase/formamidase family protein [Thermaerobacter sp.]|nr:acetamidase/formamidase family protein [Thermaerobacter sp.]